MSAKNEDRDVILAELARWQVTVDGDGSGGKHAYVTAVLPSGMTSKFHYSRSPGGSYWRLENIKHQVRRRMRALGIPLKPDASVPAEAKPARAPSAPVSPAQPAHPAAPAQPIVVPRVQVAAKTQEKTMEETEKKTYRKRITFAEVSTITRLLIENSEVINGEREFKPDWNDKRIAEVAKAVHPDAAIDTGRVYTLRYEGFPDWKKRKLLTPAARTNLEERIEALERRIQLLEDAITSPRPAKANGLHTHSNCG